MSSCHRSPVPEFIPATTAPCSSDPFCLPRKLLRTAKARSMLGGHLSAARMTSYLTNPTWYKQQMPQWECHLSPMCCPGIGTVYLIGCGQSRRTLYIKMEDELHKWRWKEFWRKRLIGKKKNPAFFSITSGLKPGGGTQNNRLKITSSKFVFSSSHFWEEFAIIPLSRLI